MKFKSQLLCCNSKECNWEYQLSSFCCGLNSSTLKDVIQRSTLQPNARYACYRTSLLRAALILIAQPQCEIPLCSKSGTKRVLSLIIVLIFGAYTMYAACSCQFKVIAHADSWNQLTLLHYICQWDSEMMWNKNCTVILYLPFCCWKHVLV